MKEKTTEVPSSSRHSRNQLKWHLFKSEAEQDKKKEIIGGLPDGSDSKESTCNAGELDSIPGSGRAPEEGNGNSLQYSSGIAWRIPWIEETGGPQPMES